ncbi:hypothetical protein B0H14DRAFT_1165969 [Mycena olivaceomarginata]|nr:hypothetical protein B0H14DRAFT_1165969 [Mycena olivaceomarginata]
MHRPRDCGVLLAAPCRPGAGRRRRDVAVPCDDYFYDFSLSPLSFSTRANSLTTRSRKRHRRPRRMLSHFPPAQTILIRRRCISTTRRALSSRSGRVLLRRQRALKPRGRRFRFSSPHARCAHFSLPFLYIHSFIPLVSYILYILYPAVL